MIRNSVLLLNIAPKDIEVSVALDGYRTQNCPYQSGSSDGSGSGQFGTSLIGDGRINENAINLLEISGFALPTFKGESNSRFPVVQRPSSKRFASLYARRLIFIGAIQDAQMLGQLHAVNAVGLADFIEAR